MANRLTEGSRPPIQMAPRTAASGNASPRNMDETEYLMSSPTNARRLREAIKQLESIGGTPKEPAE